MYRQDVEPFKEFRLIPGSKAFSTEGCAICCIFSIAEQESPFYLSIDSIKQKIKDMYYNGFIDNEFTVLGQPGWIGCFDLLGVRAKEVKYITNPRYIAKSNEREILVLKKPGYQHFVHGDGEGHYVWDSLGKRPQQKSYRVVEKRIIVL